MVCRQGKKNIKRTGRLIGGLLIGFPLISTAAIAAPGALNPCPRIYYEEPFNSTRAVPQGCPPNAATQLLIDQGSETPQPTPTNEAIPSTSAPAQPPLPETLEEPIATITTNGTVAVRLRNNTNTSIAYEAIGHTDQRLLAGKEEVVLQLPTPVTIRMVREDGGFLEVTPVETAETGVLSISLSESTNFGNNQGALRIQEDGRVFLN
ncbi:hypothetical protein IFO70_28620 [Phormidium tenue FACHB-886]|nr:hypothetical protein [Phormidium tenue FACHB-886]